LSATAQPAGGRSGRRTGAGAARTGTVAQRAGAATGSWRRPAPGTRELRVEVRPPWPFRLPRGNGMDGVLRCRDGVVQRLLHRDGQPVVVRVAQTAPDRVLFGAQARSEEAAAWGIERMRFALGVDDDLRPFHDRFRDDPLIGAAVRAKPTVRLRRRPVAFEALAWAITEQLIEYVRAAAIQRRIVWKLGRHDPVSGLRDLPSAATVAAQAPALFCSFDLADKRALALRRAAREVASGRVDLDDPDHERGWERLDAIPEIGSWTLEVTALLGQGRMDQLPAGDLAYRKLVGRLLSGGDPRARVEEDEVRAFFAPYGEWAGLAGAYALRAAAPELKAVASAA
jgi:3-methyladenine DNA glycosylase/8-oxoguanine DNA glycosylase